MFVFILKKLTSKLKLFSIKQIVVFSIIATSVYINIPRFKPYIIILETKINLSVEENITSVVLEFDEEVMINNVFVSLESPKTKKRTALSKESINKVIKHIEITVNILNKANNGRIFIDVLCKTKPIKITKIFFNDRKVDISKFFNINLLNDNKRIKKVNLIRENLSFFLYNINDVFGNYVLTFITIILFFLGYFLLIKLYYFLFHRKFRNYILMKTEKIGIERIRDFYSAEYLKQEKFFYFLSILGPAIGFLLTVSSLIAGLNPGLFVAENVYNFIQAIQLAMVSTFLGLLMRIISLLILTINRSLLTHFESIIIETENAKSIQRKK